jgi:hypothetical protein
MWAAISALRAMAAVRGLAIAMAFEQLAISMLISRIRASFAEDQCGDVRQVKYNHHWHGRWHDQLGE